MKALVSFPLSFSFWNEKWQLLMHVCNLEIMFDVVFSITKFQMIELGLEVINN